MKKFLIYLTFFMSFSANANDKSQESMIDSALKNDYQSQRNLAFSYSSGWGAAGESDFIPKSPVHACAWRKIVLLTNTAKAGDEDYSGESLDCKNVPPAENKEVWKLVLGILQEMSK